MSVNKSIILGRLGKDPELKYLPDQTAVVNFSVACSERWKDKNSGEQKERTEWINCNAFGKSAEVIAQYFHKGSQIYIEGSQRTRKYQHQDGSDRYSTSVRVDTFDFIDKKDSNTQTPQMPYQQNNQQAQQSNNNAPYEDDIPF